MKPNNHVCGVGVAYGAKIGMKYFLLFIEKQNLYYFFLNYFFLQKPGGIRMLDGKIDDRIEGESLKHALDK